MILGCVQPSYLAWIPFFKRMQASDVFVYLDDVKFSKNSPHNRNKIKTRQGELMLTVPVRYKGNSEAFIRDMPLDNSQGWAEKHWKSIEMNYAKAPHFAEVALGLKPIYEVTWDCLGPLNIALLEYFRRFLGIQTPCHLSSELHLEGEANLKLVNMCKKLGADHFLVKPNTKNYHPPSEFEPQGVFFSYFSYTPSAYPQLYGDFIPGLSILDYIMNCGRSPL